ncbi:MAG TPA: rod shape-determining protein RodA [Bacteroidetes bacterium]|nr:rod shape-determining protein RodA [Bacteroidota bacterium]
MRTSGTNLDFITFSIYLALVGIGWAMIYTVGYGQGGYSGDFFSFLKTSAGKQLIWVAVAMGVFVVSFAIDSKFWQTFSSIIYAACLLSLVAVLIFGKTIKGATSWFDFGAGITLQPSEFMKFGTCVALAGYLSSYANNLRSLKTQLYSIGIFALPMLLILLQPDAGSAMVFLAFFVVLYREGFPGWVFALGFSVATIFVLGLVHPTSYIILALAAICIFILAWNQEKRLYWLAGFGLLVAVAFFAIGKGYLFYTVLGSAAVILGLYVWHFYKRKVSLANVVVVAFIVGSILSYTAHFTFNNFLKPHQQERIQVWLQPSKADPQGAAYNLNHSKMAIGAGGLLGKGYLEGNFTQGHFVPEQITDFIFCAIGEEQGFLGVIIIIGLYLALLFRIVYIAERQKSDFNRLFAYGVASVLFIHFFINIAMTMGLMPIIGIPLPFLSKGGSSLIGFTIMIAVLLKLDASRG